MMHATPETLGGWVDPSSPIEWSHPLNRGLVGEWTVGPNAGWRGGLTLRDLVRGGRKPNDGTRTNSPPWTGSRGRPGGFGGLSYTAASTQSVSITHHASIEVFTGAFTVAFWLKANAVGTYATVWGKGDNVRLHRDTTTAGIYWYIAGLTPNSVSGLLGSPYDGAWHHLTLTYTGSRRLIYKDGVSVDDQACTGTPTGGGVSNLTFGFGLGTQAGYDGLLDGFCLWNRALSTPQVNALYQESRRGNPERWRWLSRRAWFPSTQVAGGATVTPTTLALTTATFAPSVIATANQTATPSTLALVTAAFAPVVTATNHQTAIPTTLALVTAAFAPTVTITVNQTVTPTTLALSTAAFAPTVTSTANQLVTPTTLALVTTTFAPVVTATGAQTVTPTTLALVTATFAPTVTSTANQAVTPVTLALVTAAFAPTVTSTGHQVATPTTLVLATASFAPAVAVTGHQTVTPAPLTLTLAAFAPAVTAGGSQTATPTTRALVLTSFAPTVSVASSGGGSHPFQSMLIGSGSFPFQSMLIQGLV